MNNDNRRRVLGALAALAVGTTVPGLTRGQGAIKRVGILGRGGNNDLFDHWKEHFPKEFEALGFVDGRNLKLLWFDISPRIKESEGQATGLRAAAMATAAEMGRAGLDCAVAYGEPGTHMLKEAAPNTPIVTIVSDPVGSGFAKSLARPGGNITGLHGGEREVALKTTELLKRMLPGMTCMAYVATERLMPLSGAFEAASRALDLRLKTIAVRDTDVANPARLRQEFAAMRREGCLAAHISVPTEVLGQAVRKTAVEQRIALAGSAHEDGFLLDYGAGRGREQRSAKRVPAMVARILRGEKPGDIPIEGPSSYVLRINMKTVEKLGITVPPDVALMATELVR